MKACRSVVRRPFAVHWTGVRESTVYLDVSSRFLTSVAYRLAADI